MEWQASSTCAGQGLVYDIETGRDVALTYDLADAPLVAEAPAMEAALKAIGELLADWPTMRALSALGAREATANKRKARELIDPILSRLAEAREQS